MTHARRILVRACAIHARCHSHPIFRLLGGACVRKECDHIGVHGLVGWL
jgi:hypothetical protein